MMPFSWDNNGIAISCLNLLALKQQKSNKIAPDPYYLHLPLFHLFPEKFRSLKTPGPLTQPSESAKTNSPGFLATRGRPFLFSKLRENITGFHGWKTLKTNMTMEYFAIFKWSLYPLSS